MGQFFLSVPLSIVCLVIVQFLKTVLSSKRLAAIFTVRGKSIEFPPAPMELTPKFQVLAHRAKALNVGIATSGKNALSGVQNLVVASTLANHKIGPGVIRRILVHMVNLAADWKGASNRRLCYGDVLKLSGEDMVALWAYSPYDVAGAGAKRAPVSCTERLFAPAANQVHA